MEESKRRKGMRNGVRIDIPVTGEIEVYPVGKAKKMGKGGMEGVKNLQQAIKDSPIQNVSLFEGIGVLRHEGST